MSQSKVPDLPAITPVVNSPTSAWLLDLWRAEIDLAAKVGWVIPNRVDAAVLFELDPDPQKKMF